MAYVGKITDTNGVTGPVGSTLYGTCDTAAATVAKVVTCADFDKLITGVTIHVKFTNNNTSTNPTMDVNSTGAKRIYRYGTTAAGTSSAWSWYAGAVVSFTYDGSAWIMNDMIGNDNNFDRTSIQMRIYAGTNGVFPYSIVALDKNQRMQAMTTTGGTGTSKAFNSSQKFLYPPYIYYHSENSTKANGAVITNNVLYEQFPNVNMTYSCNITTSAGFAQYKPVYIECTFDSDGYWSPTGITQTFTSGKFYILLGVMYSTSIYQVALTAQHPVFYYDGTNLVTADFGSQNISSGSQTFHPILAGPNHSGSSTFDTGCADILDYTSDIYSDTTNRVALFMKRVCASDGGALVANNFSVAQVWGTPNPSDPSAEDLLVSRTGAVIAGGAYRHQTKGENNERYIGDIIRGYAGKSNVSGTGQLVGVGGNGLTMVCGGPIINTFANAIADDQSVSEPARLNLYQDTAGDDITDVGYGFYGRTPALVLGSYRAIFLVGTTSDGQRRRGVYFNPGSDVASTASFSPAENLAVNLGATGHRWANGYINTLFGGLDSSVTAVTQGIHDSTTKVATTEYVHSINDRVGVAYYNDAWSTPAPTNVWAKIGSYSATSSEEVGTASTRTVFIVSQWNSNLNKKIGILVCGSLVDYASAEPTELECKWLFADTNIDPDDFVIVATDTDSSNTRQSTIELWVRWTKAWQGYIFKPIAEHVRSNVRYAWTFENKRAVDGQASYTVGSTSVVSSFDSLNATVSSANKLTTNAGNSNTPVYFLNGVPTQVTLPASGAWFTSQPHVDGSGVMEIGRYVDFHATSASTNNYDMRLDASSTALMTLFSANGGTRLRIYGTTPKLTFTNSTSGKTYDNANCGIVAYAGDTNGVNMTLQSGGNLLIGGGESPTNIYNGTKEAIDGWSASGESTYITADSHVFFYSKANSFADRYVMQLKNDGNLLLPIYNTTSTDSGQLKFRYGTNTTQTEHTLKSAATDTAARTWTLPDRSGTLATEDQVLRGGSLYFTSYGNTYWGKVMSIVVSSQTTYGTLLSVSQCLGSKTTTSGVPNVGVKAAGILQISCATNSSKNCNATNTAAIWLVAGGNIIASNFKLIAKDSTPASGSCTFELWIKNTATYHPWMITPMVENYAGLRGEHFTFYDARNGDATTTEPTGTGTNNFTSTFFTPVTS